TPAPNLHPLPLHDALPISCGRELYIADIPFVDALSFTFLAYAAFCLARAALAGREPLGWTTAIVAGVLMMALDVVIDPLAVRGRSEEHTSAVQSRSELVCR